jgi:hypothetical protein
MNQYPTTPERDLAHAARQIVRSLDAKLQHTEDLRGAMIGWADIVMAHAGVPAGQRDAVMAAVMARAGYEWTHTDMGQPILRKVPA